MASMGRKLERQSPTPNLATIVKRKQKIFLEMHQQQEDDQGELPALMVVTQGEEKAETLNAFFAPVFISKTWFFGYPPSNVADRDRKLNEAPTTQEEMVSHLLDHFDLHKSVGLDEVHPP